MPYLVAFDDENGIHEVPLRKDRTLIGRAGGIADVQLDHPTVSRIHAAIIKKGKHFFIEDAKSRYGTFLDRERIYRPAILRHGSFIQLGDCSIEFRGDDHEQRKKADSINEMPPIDRSLRMNFKRMPEAIRIAFRRLRVEADRVFSAGDTFLVGGGGILLPTDHPAPEMSVVELSIRSPNRGGRVFVGEVLAVIEDEGLPAMCVKLHLPSEANSIDPEALKSCARGQWVVAQEGQLAPSHGTTSTFIKRPPA